MHHSIFHPRDTAAALGALTAILIACCWHPASGATIEAMPIADQIQAKGSAIVNPAAGTVVFEGPVGSGRSGAKGILLKAPPLAPNAGSTWAFRYSRTTGAYPAQIIHPLGDGQIVIHLFSAGVGVSSPKMWIEAGYGHGNTNQLTMTEASKEVFPMKDKTDYQVVSRLSTDGRYELLLDGVLVASGRLDNAQPVNLEIPEGKTFPGRGRGTLEFKGADLPTVWSPGWAAIFLGPTDDRFNVARSVQYYPNFVDVAHGALAIQPGAPIAPAMPVAPLSPAVPPTSAGATPPSPPPATGNNPVAAAAQPPNLLKNGGFEKGTEGWESHSWGKQATFTMDPAEAHEGHASVRIDHQEAADSYLNQAVTLKPGTQYRLSGWIKAKKIVKAEGQRNGEVGASLAVLGGYDHTENVIDSKEWKYVSLDFSSGTKTELKVGPRLGHYGKLVTGSAWFADITLVELSATASVAPLSKRVPPPSTSSVAPTKPGAPPALTAAELVKANRSNLVFVTTPNGAGSGFIASYRAGTFLVTNAHVAAEAKGAVYKTLDGTQVQIGAPAAAVGHDVFRIAIQPTGTPLQVMSEVDENSAIGDAVVVLGNAEGAGVINAITGKIVGLGPNLVEIDAPFQPGNSGSPIIHLKTGKVIGVATYLTVRKYDSATKEAVKEPVVRRFGYRLDTVRIWQPANWQAFYAQAAEMDAIEKLTGDLANFLRDLSEDGRVTRGAHTNPVIKNRIDAWIEAKSKHLSPRDAAMADQSMLSFLKLTCQSDIAAVQPRLTYDYFQRQLADQQGERTEIAGIFGKIIENVRQ